MPKQITTTKKVHPFVIFWAVLQKQLRETKTAICEANNWSEQTFYNKLALGQKNKLKLTDSEKSNIARITGLNVNIFN